MKAADVRAALKRYYAQPNYGIVFEVAQATGFNARRHLDAMVMGLWPSRGLTLYGIEIKVNLYDWRKELAQPQKAEELARFCDYFYVAAPTGCVPHSEVPDKWGLLEVGEDGKITEAKAAGKHDAQPVGREFLAAIFRASSREVDPESLDALVRKREREIEAQHDERVKAEVERITARRNEQGQLWEKLCEDIGVDQGWYPDKDIIAAVRAVHKSGVAKSWSGLRTLEKSLREALEGVQAVATDLDLPVTTEADTLSRHVRKRRSA